MSATMAMASVGFAEAKNNLSALTAKANATGRSFTILKNNKPWVQVRPLAVQPKSSTTISIVPLRREVHVPDLDEVFARCDAAPMRIAEDGFAGAVGREAI